MSLYIGLMSGTSMDGVDAALVSFDGEDGPCRILHSITAKYPTELRTELARAILPGARFSLHEFASLNISVGRWFAHTVSRLLDESEYSGNDVVAIGSHGQTLRHSPDTDPAYSVQIGDPATIATRCSIMTVADFRSLDIAAGGQGAPLVPAFHEACFRDDVALTIVINIGGIANITVLPPKDRGEIVGFDTGPGNCLLDGWIWQERQIPFDDGGQWAASGKVLNGLLTTLMTDDYIHRSPPKSTGREYFNLEFLERVITDFGKNDLNPEDVQATLLEYTAASITSALEQSDLHPDRVLICGGGANNETLMGRLRALQPEAEIVSTAAYGLDPNAVEAAAFAWLARQRIKGTSVSVTTGNGALARILGAVYLPTR